MNVMQRLSVVIGSLFLLGACSPIKMPKTETYSLSPVVPAQITARHPQQGTLLVTTPREAAGFKGDKMVYVQHPYQLSYFVKHKWVDNLGVMLQPSIVSALQSTHHFQSVTGEPFTGMTTWRLDSTVLTLAQNFMTHPSQVDLSIEARLVRTSTQQIIADKIFTVSVPAPTDTPYGGVIAANAAVSEYLRQLVLFITVST